MVSYHIIQYDTRHHITKQLTKYSKGENNTTIHNNTRDSTILHCPAQPYHTIQYESHHTTPHHNIITQHSIVQGRTTLYCPAAHDRAEQAATKAT